MLTIEDLMEKLETLKGIPVEITNTDKSYTFDDNRFIRDITSYSRMNKSLSSSQGKLCIKIISKYRDILENNGINKIILDSVISSPIYRLPLYESLNIKREVRYAGDNKIIFRFKYNPTIIDELRKLRHHNMETGMIYPIYNKDLKLWIMEITKDNSDKIMSYIKTHKFEFENDLVEYFFTIENAKTSKDDIKLVGDKIIITNNTNNEWLKELKD